VSGHVVVLSTVATVEDGERLARSLVERRLAACVSVLPGLTSTYRWQGVIRKDEERLLVIKTRADRYEELRSALVEMHPYDVPEVVALSVAAGHGPYLGWIDESL
jgi:periplasmic divalent cation tolerance protein